MLAPPSQTSGRTWRTWISRVVVIATVVMALLTWQRSRPVECLLAFGFGPSIRAADGHGLSRADIRRIDGRVFDEDQREVARLSQTLTDGVSGPSTPALVLRLPGGTYTLQLEIHGLGDRRAERTRPLTIDEGGYQRLDVD